MTTELPSHLQGDIYFDLPSGVEFLEGERAVQDLTALSEIVAKIIEATTTPTAWDEVCDRIVDLNGATAFMVYEYDLVDHRSPSFYGSQMTRDVGAPLVKVLQEGEANEDQEAYNQVPRYPHNTLIPEYRLFRVDHDLDMPKNRFRDAVLGAGNSKSRSVARMNEIGPWLDVIGLHMPCYGAEIGDEVYSCMKFILPIMRKALETGRLLRTLTSHYGMLLDAFDMLEFAAAFCTSNGRLLIANQRMREMFGDRDAISVSGSGLISAAEPEHRSGLNAMLTAAVRPETPAGGLWMQLARCSGRAPLVAKAAAVRVAGIGNADAQPVLLLLADPEDDRRIHAEGLAAFGLLTPAEIDICRWLLRGTDTAEIAERRSTSIETVRTQIKSAADKLACRSRLDLLRIAMATSLPRTSARETEVQD